MNNEEGYFSDILKVLEPTKLISIIIFRLFGSNDLYLGIFKKVDIATNYRLPYNTKYF